MTFITQGGEGQGNTSKKSKATKSKGRGLEEGASRALMRYIIPESVLYTAASCGASNNRCPSVLRYTAASPYGTELTSGQLPTKTHDDCMDCLGSGLLHPGRLIHWQGGH